MEKELQHPRDRFITIFGHNPVIEALGDASLQIDKVLVDRDAKNGSIREIVALAKARNIPCQHVAARDVSRISKNPKQDQGVAADVVAPNMATAEEFFKTCGDGQIIAIDGITTPANVGMIIRSAAAAGVTGIILPRFGTAEIGPLVVKASAGTIFKTRLIRCEKIEDALQAAVKSGFAVVGLDGVATENLFEADLPKRAVYVMGNETEGMSAPARALVTRTVKIPMAVGVESLNVAAAAAVVCFETKRRELT